MKTIKSLKDITTLEVDDVVIISNFRHVVSKHSRHGSISYYLNYSLGDNDRIFEILNLEKRNFVENLGIAADCNCDFPETKSLEALTAIVSALFKEYEKQNELPKTWEEFCEGNRIKDNYFIDNCSNILRIESLRDPNIDKNVCTSKQEAKAFLALMQLRQLRKAYVKDWEPDWNGVHDHNCIIVCQQMLVVRPRGVVSHTLSFPTSDLATQFLTNFKDLLEIAKPLL